MSADAECAFAEKNGRAIFAVLDDQRLRADGEDFAGGAGQAGFVGQHLGFAVVNQQNVHHAEGFAQLGVGALDPEIHGVAASQLYVRQVTADGCLQAGMDIAEKKDVAVAVLGGNSRLEFFEDVQVGEIGFGFVEIVEILSAPAKGLPFRVLDAAGVHAAFLQDVFVFGGEVLANDGDDAYVSEITGGEREIGCGAAENVLSFPGGRGDVVEGDGTDGEYAHD